MLSPIQKLFYFFIIIFAFFLLAKLCHLCFLYLITLKFRFSYIIIIIAKKDLL